MVEIKVIDEPTCQIGVGTEVNYVANDDYEKLRNKPLINDVELVGNKSSRDIGILDLSNTEIDRLVNMIFKR